VVARPHVEHAAVATKDAAIHAAEVARPKVEAAAKVAFEKASDAATAAKPSVDRLADKGKDILVAAESKRPILVKVA
jgi:predicted regulator of Ras-like GTPase activity (Roadblock/LC7/MglB family)